jgi:hypothetical protein
VHVSAACCKMGGSPEGREMDIGKPRRVITVEPTPEPAAEPVPAEPAEEPAPAIPNDR